MKLLIKKIFEIRAEIYWITAGQLSVFLGSFLGIKLLTNLISEDGYGEFVLGLSIAGMINLFIFAPLGQIIFRYFSYSKSHGEESICFSLLVGIHKKFIFMIFVLASIAGLLIYIFFNFKWAFLVFIAAIFGIVSGLLGSLQILFNAALDRKSTAISQSLDVWLRVIFAFIFFKYSDESAYWGLLGYLFASLLTLLIQFNKASLIIPSLTDDTYLHQDLKITKKYQDEFKRFGLPFLYFAIFVVVSQYGDRWVLQGLMDTRDVGIYAVLYQIGSAPVNVLSVILNQLITPKVYSKVGKLSKQEDINSGIRLLELSRYFLTLLYGVVVIIAYFYSEFIINLLTNENYAEHSQSLWVVVMGSSIFQLAQLMTVNGLSQKSSSRYLWPKILQAISLLFFGFFLVSKFGLTGMPWAIVISSLIYYFSVIRVNWVRVK